MTRSPGGGNRPLPPGHWQAEPTSWNCPSRAVTAAREEMSSVLVLGLPLMQIQLLAEPHQPPLAVVVAVGRNREPSETVVAYVVAEIALPSVPVSPPHLLLVMPVQLLRHFPGQPAGPNLKRLWRPHPVGSWLSSGPAIRPDLPRSHTTMVRCCCCWCHVGYSRYRFGSWPRMG